jgi:hypothetical protein
MVPLPEHELAYLLDFDGAVYLFDEGYTLVTGEPGNLFHRSPPPRSCVGEGDPEGVEGAFRAKDSLNNPL